jgi:hypothetical protein
MTENKNAAPTAIGKRRTLDPADIVSQFAAAMQSGQGGRR